MFITERNKSKQHIHLETLERRAELSKKESLDLGRYRSGYAGEKEYDTVFDETGHDHLYIFRDIWLRIDNGNIQFDALIVADNIMIVNEIKNYSGNYSYENDM
ncbi:nuclease-related domain-containing protein [Salinicoccus sp. HZC-1]|uniref:nuclease-related domain-containing protein n=1 Tax=Salinicoccus sp. HZC-1 TaxID=3385497 RepID=UPI00398A93C5